MTKPPRRVHQFQVRPIPGAAASLVFAWPPVAASCCDGRLVAMLVNRDGNTRCVDCDTRLRDAARVATP